MDVTDVSSRQFEVPVPEQQAQQSQDQAALGPGVEDGTEPMARAGRKLFFAALAILLGFAAGVPVPTANASDETLLTLTNPLIEGKHGVIHFTLADLQALQQQEISTTNDFVDGKATFRGPSAYALIDQIGRAGARLVRMTAANDYFVEIEIHELYEYGAILAMEMNGKGLTRRDRGPIWLMYPIDDFEELQTPSVNNRLIWQLKTIELR